MEKSVKLDIVKLIKPVRHYDKRGFFVETYTRKNLIDIGINHEFLQDNHSLSYKKGTLRGLHFQAPPYAQAKLIMCAKGAIFDVVVDIRVGSPKFGKWQGYELTAENGNQLYVPVGFAHGFLSMMPNSEVIYKCSEYYNKSSEMSLLWNDPDIGIKWPMENHFILSEKDKMSPRLRDINSPFLYEKKS